jgi:hypothetical protein
MGTPPMPRHCRIDWQDPSIEVVVGVGDPGIIVVTLHAGPFMNALMTGACIKTAAMNKMMGEMNTNSFPMAVVLGSACTAREEQQRLPEMLL